MGREHGKTTGRILLVGAALVLALASCAGMQQARLPEPGERLAVEYICRLADGSLAATTDRKLAQNGAVKKSALFAPSRTYGRVEVEAPGEPGRVQVDPLAGLEKNIEAAIAERIGGVPLGKTTSLTLAGAVPKNLAPQDRYLKMAVEFSRSRTVEMPGEYFERRYGREPAPGLAVGAGTDFPGVVQKVTGQGVTILYSVKPGAVTGTGYGLAKVAREGDRLRFRMEVKPGQIVRTGPLAGRVGEVGEKTFTIDYGHPFGGETLFCDVVATPAAKALANRKDIAWHEDFGEGTRLARQEGKPLVLVLYADWCPWCHRLFDEVLPDPELAGMRDKFVWVRINSDRKKEFMERFDQKGFPLIVVLSEEGRELEKLKGFRSAPALKSALSKFDKSDKS